MNSSAGWKPGRGVCGGGVWEHVILRKTWHQQRQKNIETQRRLRGDEWEIEILMMTWHQQRQILVAILVSNYLSCHFIICIAKMLESKSLLYSPNVTHNSLSIIRLIFSTFTSLLIALSSFFEKSSSCDFEATLIRFQL